MVNARILIFLLISGISCSIVGMTFDNRFFPLLDKPILRHDDVHFFFRAQPFIMFADEASLRDEEDREGAGLFDGEGKFFQHHLDSALGELKKSSKEPLRPDLAAELQRATWSFPGRLDAAGVALRWYYRLNPNWEIGGSWLFIGARSRIDRILREGELLLTDGDRRDLEASHELSMLLNKTKSALWSKVGIGDLDLYVRLGMLKHYFLRFKTFDAGIKLGVIAPLAERRDIFNAASLPFGGNGHWGFYADAAVHTELKDDLFAGLNVRFIQRLPRTQTIRIPLRSDSTKSAQPDLDKNEKDTIVIPQGVPLNFSPAIGLAQVIPGFTFVFAPYVGLGGIRDGFGAQLQYTLIMHTHDSIHDRRHQPAAPLDVEFFKYRSEWAREYITFSILYDFAQNKEYRGRAPLLSLDVDFPVGFLASKQSFKTVGISLRIESDLW